MSALLDIRNLNVMLTNGSRPFVVSQHTNLEINKGEIVGLIGESGCGKTLTTLSLTGLLPKGARVEFDSYLFDNKIISPTHGMLRRLRGEGIAFIFQEPGSHLNPLFTIGDQLRETILIHASCSKKQAETMTLDILEDVGLKPAASYVKKYAHQLSGGMNQRAMIALALSCQPRLLVADEPTTALDPTTKKEIVELVKSLTLIKQLAVVWISHDISLMESFAHRIFVMYAGFIVEAGTSTDVILSPAHPYTQGLIACLPGHRSGREFIAIPGEPPDLADLPKGCPFNPRCPYVMERCLLNIPDFFSKTSTQKARCFLLQKT
jgi:oligopeptide/dipeptide ABC transporter ATP-binding protein